MAFLLILPSGNLSTRTLVSFLIRTPVNPTSGEQIYVQTPSCELHNFD